MNNYFIANIIALLYKLLWGTIISAQGQLSS